MADVISRAARFTPRDLYTLPIVGFCALNTEQSAVAYAVTRLDEETNTYRSRIRVLALNGADSQAHSKPRDLTDGNARDHAPQWSSDGSAIFFLSDRSGSVQLWQVPATSGDVLRMPDIPGNISEFAVAPNGRHIAVITTPTANKDAIERQGWRRVTRIRYRADGPGYLDDFPELWLIDLTDKTTLQVTDGSGFIAAVAWSADGSRLAFSGDHEADADTLWRRELWVASKSDRWKPKRILTFKTAIEAPAWSPDGSLIAFCGVRERSSRGMQSLRLHVVNVDTKQTDCWTPEEEWTCGNFVLSDVGAAGSVLPPVWDGNDRALVLGSSRGAARVFRVSQKQEAVAVTPPTTSVSYFSPTRASQILHCSSTQIAPPELYVSKPAGATMQLTREADGWNEPAGDLRYTHFEVKSAGVNVDAWHVQGIGDGSRPCILYIHGGPHFAYGYAYVFHFAALASAGYDVVFCNPRGSQSYGEAFANMIFGNWAQPAFDDCMAVLDAAIERFAPDPARLGVAGGSYGGYLTIWTICHTSRFAAAVALRPATSLFSIWGTSEVGRMLAEDFGGTPFEMPEFYLRDSPLTHAGEIRTPLLVVYGSQDWRAPAEQSEQLLTALLKRGATVEGLHFPNADHNISRNGPPRQRVAHEEAILDWFDRYLKPKT